MTEPSPGAFTTRATWGHGHQHHRGARTGPWLAGDLLPRVHHPVVGRSHRRDLWRDSLRPLVCRGVLGAVDGRGALVLRDRRVSPLLLASHLQDVALVPVRARARRAGDG